MFEMLDQRASLTGNQIKILSAAIIGDALEFFDYFLIGFVLAFLIGPWKLTFGQSAVVLMSSGIGAIMGAYVWGWLADRIGRRKVFIGTVLNFSIATGLLYFTPDNGWIYLSYAEPGRDNGSMTAIVRGRIKDNKWVDQQFLFHAPELNAASNIHYGSRFIFDKQGHLFFTIGAFFIFGLTARALMTGLGMG